MEGQLRYNRRLPKPNPAALSDYLDILGEVKGVAVLLEQTDDPKQITRYIRQLNALKEKLVRARPRLGKSKLPKRATRKRAA